MADPELVNKATEAVQEYCTPEKMSKEDAIDFLEDVVSQLESLKEALEEEIENEKEEDDGEGKDT